MQWNTPFLTQYSWVTITDSDVMALFMLSKINRLDVKEQAAA